MPHDLGAAGAGVDQEPDKRGVGAVLEAATAQVSTSPAELVVGEDGDRLQGTFTYSAFAANQLD